MRGSRNSSDSLGLAAFRTLVANDVDEEVAFALFLTLRYASTSLLFGF